MNSDSKSIHFLNAPCFNCVKNYAKLTLKGQIPFGDQHITKLLTLTQLSSFYEPVTTPPTTQNCWGFTSGFDNSLAFWSS